MPNQTIITPLFDYGIYERKLLLEKAFLLNKVEILAKHFGKHYSEVELTLERAKRMLEILESANRIGSILEIPPDLKDFANGLDSRLRCQ